MTHLLVVVPEFIIAWCFELSLLKFLGVVNSRRMAFLWRNEWWPFSWGMSGGSPTFVYLSWRVTLTLFEYLVTEKKASHSVFLPLQLTDCCSQTMPSAPCNPARVCGVEVRVEIHVHTSPRISVEALVVF